MIQRVGADDPDLAACFLRAVLAMHQNAFLVELVKQLVEQWEETEDEGKEAMLTVAMLVHRAGGRVRVSRRDYEAVKALWLQRRPSDEGDAIEYRVIDQPPTSRRPR
jgi:hypothetical protein